MSIIQSKKEIREYNLLPSDEQAEFLFEWSNGITNYKESYYYNIFSNKRILGLSQYINSVKNTETRKKIR
jgi:hypothetical protein